MEEQKKNRIMKTKMETKEKETDSNIKIYDDIQIEYNYSPERLLAGICVLIFGLVVMVILMTVLCLCL